MANFCRKERGVFMGAMFLTCGADGGLERGPAGVVIGQRPFQTESGDAEVFLGGEQCENVGLSGVVIGAGGVEVRLGGWDELVPIEPDDVATLGDRLGSLGRFKRHTVDGGGETRLFGVEFRAPLGERGLAVLADRYLEANPDEPPFFLGVPEGIVGGHHGEIGEKIEPGQIDPGTASLDSAGEGMEVGPVLDRFAEELRERSLQNRSRKARRRRRESSGGVASQQGVHAGPGNRALALEGDGLVLEVMAFDFGLERVLFARFTRSILLLGKPLDTSQQFLVLPVDGDGTMKVEPLGMSHSSFPCQQTAGIFEILQGGSGPGLGLLAPKPKFAGPGKFLRKVDALAEIRLASLDRPRSESVGEAWIIECAGLGGALCGGMPDVAERVEIGVAGEHTGHERIGAQFGCVDHGTEARMSGRQRPRRMPGGAASANLTAEVPALRRMMRWTGAGGHPDGHGQ